MTADECASCDHKHRNDDHSLHCYMFKVKPAEWCAQHTDLAIERKAFGEVFLKLFTGNVAR